MEEDSNKEYNSYNVQNEKYSNEQYTNEQYTNEQKTNGQAVVQLPELKNTAPELSKYELGDYCVISIAILLCIATAPLSIFCIFHLVQEYERAVIFRLGKVKGKDVGPGCFLTLPCTDEFKVVDMRTVIFDVPPQEILTKDSVTVAMDAVVYCSTFDACTRVTRVDNADQATKLLAQTTLRNTMGTKTLAQILTDRDTIAAEMSEFLDNATDSWGIKVERIEVKDVVLPPQLQRAMAAEAEASREAKAKVIAAEGEMNASMKLKEAADTMNDSPNAMQLRYLQTLNTISAQNNQTIVFPLPLELMRKWAK